MVKTQLSLYHYNNYFNRVLKFYENLEEYDPYYCIDANGNAALLTSTNWNPNDGVNTTVVVNWNGEEPDYLIVSDMTNSKIISRWFVLDSTRNTYGQYTLTLRRDVLADFYPYYSTKDMFIEKGIASENDIAIYNKEDFDVNQIKKEELLLKDFSDSAWIVGYLKYVDTSKEGIQPFTGDLTIKIEPTPDAIYSGTKAELKAELEKKYLNGDVQLSFVYSKNVIEKPQVFVENPYFTQNSGLNVANYYKVKDLSKINSTYNSTVANTFRTKAATFLSTLEGGATVNANKSNIQYEYANKIVRCSDGIVKYKFSTTSETKIHRFGYDTNETDLLNTFNNYLLGNGIVSAVGQSNAAFMNYFISTPKVEEISSNSLSGVYNATINTDNINHLSDIPCCGFCIPFSKYTLGYTDSGSVKLASINEELAKKIASNISSQFSSACMDIQIVPFCPFPQQFIDGTNRVINLKSSEFPQIADLSVYRTILTFKQGTTPMPANDSFILWFTQGAFSIDLEKPITSAYNKKIDNQCRKYRICSPNGNGLFEFSKVYNNNIINSFNVDCLYQPYQPYIHIAPNFEGLYGQDFNDYRGLTCSGDFSFPQTSNAWTDFQINNKNYENMFNREVQTLEFNRSKERISDWANVIGNSIGQGGQTAATTGNPYLAAASGTLSLGAGITDNILKEEVYQEGIRYKKDMYNYSLENVQAIPNSITKTSCLNPNNKLFPYIEIYDCTETEREAFIKKVGYNGMTIGRIGKMSDFTNTYWYDYLPYFKAQMIRFDDLPTNFHEAAVINEELNKGVYVNL